MKALEDVAKKYCEEILPFAPVSSVCAFFVGISLNRAALSLKASAWVQLFGDDFKSYWYFLDILKSTKVGLITAAAVVSLFSCLVFRWCSEQFLNAGVTSQMPALRVAYGKILAGVEPSGISEKASTIAEKWYSRYEKKILGIYKLGVFIVGVSAETLMVLIVHFSWIDLTFSLVLLVLGLALSFRFGVIYYKAVLPRKMLLDASLGLLNPDSLGRLDGID